MTDAEKLFKLDLQCQMYAVRMTMRENGGRPVEEWDSDDLSDYMHQLADIRAEEIQSHRYDLSVTTH